MKHTLAATAPLVSEDDRSFLQAVGQLAFSNPFDGTRIEAEKRALGEAFVFAGPVWCRRGDVVVPNENIPRIAARLRPILDRIRDGLAAGGAFADADRTLYVEACLYFLFDTHDARFQPFIDRHVGADAIAALYPVFLAEYDRLLVVRGLRLCPSPPEHVFACIFQIRRAFHHIFSRVIGASGPAAELRAAIWRAIFTHDLRRYVRSCDRRRMDASTLVTGETGTGKELVAEAIGRSGYVAFDPKARHFVADHDRGFRALNLSAVAESLLESELFGHERGAFTGAVKDHKGLLSTYGPSDVVFFDEIGELSLRAQVTLLRVLDGHGYRRVGDTEEQTFSARVVAATHRNLVERIHKDAFRLDLYERIAAVQIATPSLQQQLVAAPGARRELVRFFAGQKVDPDEVEELTDRVEGFIEAHLRHYTWPGNVRELKRCVESVYVTGSFVPIDPNPGDDDPVRSIRALALSEEQVVRRYASMVFEKTGEKQEETARVLGINRKSVAARIDRAWLSRRAGRRGR